MNDAIKADIGDPDATRHTFVAARTMHGGKKISVGGRVFLIANATQGGAGLIAKGFVTRVAAMGRAPGIARPPPRVTVEIDWRTLAMAPLGRTELRPFTCWDDSKPETEVSFKLYSQATNRSSASARRRRTFWTGSSEPGPMRADRGTCAAGRRPRHEISH